MNSSAVFAVVMLAGFFASTSAQAGQVGYSPATVSLPNKTAYGSVRDARNSADTKQHVGCGTSATPGDEWAWCEINDAAGVQAYCTSNDPKIVATARAADETSYIQFNWDNNHICTWLAVRNYSDYAP
ncbi:hypothetical protein [Luteimonas aquatica]|uniref:hypothetical protein n=1 Tax=Luteimonas aquatica TaxID=450364 RepID=UPI001F5AFE55|nr:hypothetical protein [Luteimonas aquatica]